MLIKLKKNGETMEAYTENGKKKINYEDLDNSVLAWFHSKRSKGALINGAMIV